MHYPYIESRQLLYRPVTAYTADRPILVNGYNINTGLYPVLNYKPENALYPFIYVPIAEFSRVGAKVLWDEANQLLTVESDYYEIMPAYEDLLLTYNELEKNLEELRASYFEQLPVLTSKLESLKEENELLKSQLNS